jgi:hypothetical protein
MPFFKKTYKIIHVCFTKKMLGIYKKYVCVCMYLDFQVSIF